MWPGNRAVILPTTLLEDPSGSRSRRRLIPNRTNQRPIVVIETWCPCALSSRWIWRAVHLRSRRQDSIRSTTSSGVWVGERCGAEDRSAKPTSPSSSNRRFHLVKQALEMPASAAT